MRERYSPSKINTVNHDLAASIHITKQRQTEAPILLTDASPQDEKRLRRAVNHLEPEVMREFISLSRTERAHVIVDFADRQKERINQERHNNLLLGRLLNKGTIPIEYINADGTFQSDKISELTYFKEHPHLITALGLETRQLSEKSKVRQKAKTIFESKKQEAPKPTERAIPIQRVEEQPVDHKAKRKSKLAAAAAALLLAMTPTLGFKGGKSEIPDSKGDTKPVVKPMYPPYIPTDNSNVIPKSPVVDPTPMFTTVRAKSGQSEWKIVKEAVRDAGIQPTDKAVNVLTDITAWASIQDVPNPDVVRKGQKVTVPSVPLISCVTSRINPESDIVVKPSERQIREDIENLNELGPMSKKQIVKEKKHTLKRITDYCQKVIIFARN